MNKKTSLIVSLIKENRWNSIFFQYFKKIFLFFLIPFFIICVIIYTVFINSIENDFTKIINVSLQKTHSALSQSFTIADKYFLELSFSPQVTSFLTTNHQENPHQTQKNISYFVDASANITHNFPYIKNIIIYSNYNDYIISPMFSGYTHLFEDTPWLNACYNNKDKSIFMVSESDESFYRCYKLTENKKHLGYIIFELSSDSFHSYIYDNESSLDSIVLASDDNVFYSQIDNTDLIDNDFLHEAFANNNYFEKKSDFLLFSIRSEASDYVVISINDRHQLIETTKTFKIFFILIALMFLLVLIGVSVYLSLHIYNSFAKIIEVLEYYPNSTGNDKNEIYYISQQILSIINDKENIEKTLIDKINQLKKLQLASLNTQITPHFVFNTLNLVNAIIMNIVKKPNDAEKVVSILSDTFYYSLRNTNYLVDIQDEIHYSKKFIEIEHIKLEGNFELNFDIAPEVYNCKVLKFMIQPLVENSFVHGISSLINKKGIININIYAENGNLICSVFDNGNKINDDKLSLLNTQLKSASITENEHIGLKNINNRISLIWGNDYGCSIHSDDNGTTVIVKIPIVKE